jgi:hypothetical protein
MGFNLLKEVNSHNITSFGKKRDFETIMGTLQIHDTKLSFSVRVAEAERGRPTLGSRQNQPCAKNVPVTDGACHDPVAKPNLGIYLLGIPEQLKTERDLAPLGVACADPLVTLPA